jgi:hypothetical protein
MPAWQWGTTLVGDAEIMPNRPYAVTMVCEMGPGLIDSTPAEATTWLRGDVDGNRLINAIDIGRTVDVVKGLFTDNQVIAAANVWDCLLDDVTNAMDIGETVNAVKAIPSSCAAPCP